MSNPIHSRNIIIKPIFSEKSLKDNIFNRYHFKVDTRANKMQIKQAVEELLMLMSLKFAPRLSKVDKKNLVVLVNPKLSKVTKRLLLKSNLSKKLTCLAI